MWGLPGGLLEIGETFEETVRREVLEVTNLKISQIKLFGIYSGKNGFASTRLQFIHKKDMPSNLNPH
nr:NUDIX domain-containing protein [Brevibacillus antibioticus]